MIPFERPECSESELADLKERILNGLDAIAGTRKLNQGEFPKLAATRPEVYLGWRSATTYQQGTLGHCLVRPPQSRIPLEQGYWVMDMRIQYFPRFAFYVNEKLWWKLPRRIGIADAFFNQRRCRIDAEHSISVEMRHLDPLILRLPDESEIFHRAAGISEISQYDSSLKAIVKKPQFCQLANSDKGRYLNGILELFGGLQSASSFVEHSYWRGIFERLSVGAPAKQAGLLERVRNGLEKKRALITEQLTGGHDEPIDWLSRLIVRHAREVHLGRKEIYFSEFESSFQEQRERLMRLNPELRNATSPEKIAEDWKVAKAVLLGRMQFLTDAGVLLQGVRVSCTNCGSGFWLEMGAVQQKVKCGGCGASVSVPVESRWCFRLNSLVANGIALHGCVAVISALRHLREHHLEVQFRKAESFRERVHLCRRLPVTIIPE